MINEYNYNLKEMKEWIFINCDDLGTCSDKDEHPIYIALRNGYKINENILLKDGSRIKGYDILDIFRIEE